MSLQKVKNVKGMLKDTKSGALLNVDNEGLRAYKIAKRKRQEHNSEFALLAERVNTLELMVKTLVTDLRTNNAISISKR